MLGHSTSEAMDEGAEAPALQNVLVLTHQEISRLADELAQLKTAAAGLSSERDQLAAALAAAQAEARAQAGTRAELEAAVARLSAERNAALGALSSAEAKRDALGSIHGSCQELATEVRKVLRAPWRPLAQRTLYLLFSCLAFPLPGAVGRFFEGQARQRTPRRLQTIVREAEAARERLIALEARDDRSAPADETSSPADIARRILVAASRISRAVVGVLQDLRALGYEVTFVPTGLRPSDRDEDDLRRLGVEVVAQASGRAGAGDFVERSGRRFGAFYLFGGDVAEAVLPVARSVAPGARIIFHALDLSVLRDGGEAQNRADPQSSRHAAEAYRREIAMMSASDHVVLVSAADLSVLRPLLPTAPISVLGAHDAPVEDAGEFGGREGEARRASFLAMLNDARVLSIPLYLNYCQTLEPTEVPAAETDVDVSVIIPAYNKWELTRACITSVLQTSIGTGVRFELILADDNSTDETVRAAQRFPGLRVVRTPENLGFLRNCNRAARTARGRYLLFLNNDAVVLPGWLEALFRTMESDPKIGVAGSKLLYPDLTIQEAGGVLFRDGSARNVGRGQRREHPLFNVARDVDYISGASILVRADFWKDVGGFDERFKIAYCEDSDLAMTARANGLSVRYQPRSEVIHFEHQSYKDEEGAAPKQLQSHNTALLLEKWKDVLSRDHGEAIQDPWFIPPAAGSRTADVLKTVA